VTKPDSGVVPNRATVHGRWPHTGAVLSGGTSKRMGVAKEHLALPNGTTMIGSVISVLDELCENVVVVGSKTQDTVAITDLRPGLGPLGGIEALLASGKDSQYLVCPNDIPLATPEVLSRLLAPTPAMATIFANGAGLPTQSLPLRVSSLARDVVTAALDRGERSIHRLLQRVVTHTVDITSDEAALLANVNTEGDYQRLLADLGHRHPS
jgi:molybdenum cofactor guanylyltransferase